MKDLRFLFLALSFTFLFSCEKDTCKTCEIVITSNVDEAFKKCEGFANNFPNGFIEESRSVYGEVCEGIPSDTEEEAGICDFVFATIRTKYVCQ